MMDGTSRTVLVDAVAAIEPLKWNNIGHVYEEQNLFFEDFSDKVVQDDVFSRWLTLPDALITGLQSLFYGERTA